MPTDVPFSHRKLIDEHPLVVLPSLATALGLDEAVLLQQLHFLLQHSTQSHDGRRWVSNTYEQWHAHFPFWAPRTLRRLLTDLERRSLLLTANYNASKADRTKWYTISYESFDQYLPHVTELASPCGQHGQSMWPEVSVHVANAVDSDQRLSSKTFFKEGKDSLTPFESLDSAGHASLPALSLTPEPASPSSAPTRTKTIQPLAADDWLLALLTEYNDRLDLEALNDDAWWTDVGNSFPQFDREWVTLAFASLSAWLRDTPKRVPRSTRGWKARMRFSLNWYYDTKWTRRLHNGQHTTR